MPAWVAAHEQQLRSILSRVGMENYASFLPTTFEQTGLAMALFLVVFVVVTAGASLRPDSFVWRTLYGGLLGVFLLHAITHALQAVAFHGYTPGLVTAFLVVVPASIYIGVSLLRRGALDLKASAVMAIVGLAIFPMAVLVAFRISHWLLFAS